MDWGIGRSLTDLGRMAEPRKIFRIEQTAATRLEENAEASQTGLRHQEIMRELQALRAALSTAAPRRPHRNSGGDNRDVTRLASELNLIADAIRGNGDDNGTHVDDTGARAESSSTASTRIGHELSAVVEGTERATQKILAAAEEIDSAANNLSAALKGKIEQNLAHDIQDLVIEIFEACNFQDLIGQRVAKILGTLSFDEDHIVRVLDEIKNPAAATRHDGAQTLHGPRLDGDDGHASQDEIDALFAAPRRKSN
jgi:chemotaxis protein CheZ